MGFTRSILAGIALALAQGQGAQAENPVPVSFEIESQPLAAALSAFASQTGLQVIQRDEDVSTEGLVAPRVAGKWTVREALDRLLADTGLRYEFVNDRTVRILPCARKGQGTQPDGGTCHHLEEIDLTALPEMLISGRVVSAHTSSPLAGALVRVLETSATTTADDQGHFRLRAPPSGEYTLSISYLGFAPLTIAVPVDAQGDAAWSVYVLDQPASGLDEVVVFGNRSSRALALNLQRSADNSSSVVSADMLGNFTDQTISEALRRIPGVSAFRRGILGDSADVSIRGLSPNMNNVQLNGLNVPNTGVGRAPALDALLADSVEKITVNETLLPSHDSAGTGGLIQIETKSPLKRPHRYANLSYEAGHKGDGRGDDETASGTLSATFGEDRDFGLSASAQYLKRSGQVFSYSSSFNQGAYLPLDPFGQPSLAGQGYFDPRTSFPFEPGVDGVYPDSSTLDFTDVSLTSRTYTLSAEWQVNDGARMQLDAQRALQVDDRYSVTSGMYFSSQYQPLPVVALDGETRPALVWDGYAFVTQDLTLTRDRKNITDTLSFRGDLAHGLFAHSWTLGYAKGALDAPDSFRMSFAVPSEEPFDPSLISAAAVDPLEGRIVSPFGLRSGRAAPLPLLTDAGWAMLNDPENYLLQPIGAGSVHNENDRYTGELTSRRDFQHSHLKYVELGVNFERARFSAISNPRLYDGTRFIDDPPYQIQPSAADLGIAFADPLAGSNGLPSGIPQVVPIEELLAFVQRLPELTAGADPVLTLYENYRDPRLSSAHLLENNLATYLQTRIEIGRFEMVGGLRAAHIGVSSVNLTSPVVFDRNGIYDVAFAERFKRLETAEDTGTDLLPRFQFNFRKHENLIFRAAYYGTVQRPRVEQLSAESSITLNLGPFAFGGPNRDQPTLNISKGNPELKPATGHNFDLGAEYYFGQVGLLKMSVYYKQIENLLDASVIQGSSLLEGVTLPDDPYFESLPDDLVVSVMQPVNSRDVGELRGVSIAAERQLTFLPLFWSGFGVYANYTVSDDRVPNHFIWYSAPVFDANGQLTGSQAVDLDVGRREQRTDSGTASLTYSRRNLDGSLSYSWQEGAAGGFQAYGIRQMPYRASSLDLRLQYQFSMGGGLYRAYFEGADLLRGTGSIDGLGGATYGRRQVVSEANYYGGRTLRLGVAATF